MRTLTIIKNIFLGYVVVSAALHADNPRQTVTKELLSKTMSGGITTLDWVVRYETNSSTALGDVIITDNFSSAQTYVPATEAHPNGWSVTQNPNQFVWETEEGQGYVRDFPVTISTLQTPGAGDGYAPIPYTALNGQKRFYYLNHHEDKNFKLFGCMGECDLSVPWPIRLPDGDPGSAETSGTSNAPETVILGRKLYYPVTRSADAGIGCYDLETNVECGYMQLSTLNASLSKATIDGLINVGNHLYIMDGNSVAYKVSVGLNGSMTYIGSFDLTTLGVSTSLFSVSTTTPNDKFYAIGSEKYGNNVYFLKYDINANDRKIACLDTTSMTGCSAWGGAKVNTSINYASVNSYLYYDSSMVAREICASHSTSSSIPGNPHPQVCLSLTNGSVVSKPDIFPSSSSVFYFTGFETTVGTKTYFPSVSVDPIFCHDWSGAACPNNTITRTSGEGLTSTNTKNYGSAVDDDGCIWLYGHNNYLWSLDPETGTTPCREKNLIIEDSYDASQNWCASKDAEWHYTQFKIDGLRPGMFSDLNITFYDASGNVIKVASIPTNSISFSQGLFTAPFVAGEPIHYKIEGTRDPNANPNWAPPVISIGVDGPPREFCFQTTVPCPVTGDITNHVEVQLKGEYSVDSSDDVVEDAGALCEEVLPEAPKQCLNAEPILKCSKTGWTIDLNTFSPSTYNATNTDMQVLAPTGATVTKWGNTWHVNGVSTGDTLSLSMQGVQVGAGKLEGGDLCCDGETNITIPEDQTCEVEEPHIYVLKKYLKDENVFMLQARVMSTIYAPQVLSLTDTLPAGITLTGIDPRSASEWSCLTPFPVSGPASLTCIYTGAMPVTGIYNLYLTSTVDNTQMPAENCVDAGVVGTDGASVYTNAMMHKCITVEHEDDNVTEDNTTPPHDTNETNTTGCQTDKDCQRNEYCSEEDGLCLSHVDLPAMRTSAIDIVTPKPSKASITLRKTAPKECKAGQKCTFKLRITNKGKSSYKGPLSITDRSKEFVGRLVGTSPKGWRCKTTGRGYMCANPKVSLKVGESTTVKLTVRIPQHAKGYLHNCAKLDFPRGKVRIMALQSMLLSNGFDPNGIDGGMGKGTKKALQAYMKSKGIKSQKTAIKRLVESYPHVTSKNSCVKVKIKKSKIKCKPYEKLVKDRCKPRCKKWQHWNGKGCISCPKGKKWDKKSRICKQQECPEGSKMNKGKCIAQKKTKCIPFITHYNSLLGICVPNISIGIGGGRSSPKGGHNGYDGPAGL